MKKTMVVVLVVLTVLLATLTLRQTYPAGAFGGGGGGGWGSPANAETIIPPWVWTWIGGLILDYAITPITDCIHDGTCTQSDGPLGGGGGGGFPQCQTGCNGGGGPNGGGGGWARPVWNWLTFQQEGNNEAKE